MVDTYIMMKTQRYLSLIVSLLIGLLLPTQAMAEQSANIYATQVHIDSDGFAIQQPVISQTEILDTLTQAHQLLSAQGQQANNIVKEHDNGANMVVAAIMPGGFIYLAYQQNKLESAQTALSEIKNELSKLDTDAVTLYKPVYQPTRQPILVARYP